jgi:hypothetical protein
MNGLLIASMAAFLAGCEWGGGGDGWNSRWDFVNFSGSYSGSPLVSAYSMTSGGGGTTDSGQSYVNRSESSTKNVQLQTIVSDTLSYTPIVEGSVTIVANGTLSGYPVGFVANDSGGSLSGPSVNIPSPTPVVVTITGGINYETGAWYLNLAASTPLVGTMTFTITYSQVTSSSGGGSSSGQPGSTKVTILTFNVQQTGNTLKIIDNNGSIYEGSFGDVSTTGGGGSGGAFASGDEIIGQYSASGQSAAGINVNMVGTFQATVSGASSGTGGTQTMTLSNRRILGTWIEDGGVTGNINGGAASVSVTTSVSTNSP